MYEDGDSFRHHVDLKRYGINPTVGVPGRAGHAHRPQLRIFPRPPHRRPRRSVRRRRAARAASTAPSSAIPTTAIAKADVNVAHARRSSTSFGDGLTLRNRTLFGDYDKFYQNIFAEQRGQRERRCRARHARRLQQPQRPPEPVQPDRPDLGKPARRDRPDPAVRLRGRPPEVAQPAPDRHLRWPATTACR